MKEKSVPEKKASQTLLKKTSIKRPASTLLTSKAILSATDAKKSRNTTLSKNLPKKSSVSAKLDKELVTPVKAFTPLKKNGKRSSNSGETTESANEETELTSKLVFYC